MKLRVISYWLLVIGAFAGTALGELTVSLKPEVESRFIYEPFTLLLETGANAQEPEIPSGNGFSVTRITKNEKGFRIELTPEQAGILNVPPFSVQAGDETVQTLPLRLPVSAPRVANEMSLSVAVSSTNLYVDEPVELTVTWSSRTPFTRCNEVQMELPILRNTNWEVYPLDPGVPEAQRLGIPVNSRRVIARQANTNSAGDQLIFSYKLVPRAAGNFKSAPMQMSCALLSSSGSANRYPSYFDNNFFTTPDNKARFERIYLSVPIPELTVRPLPTDGRTVYYSGIAGLCTATSSITPVSAVVGQPMLLTISLTNVPFGPAVKLLPKISLAGFTPEFQISSTPLNESSALNARSFTYILRPLRSGSDQIPAITLQHFDPQSKKYETVRTAPLPIEVKPDGESTIYNSTQKKTDDLKTPLNGIKNNWKESVIQMNTYQTAEFFARQWWIFLLLPPLIWLAARPLIRHLERCRTDAAYARAAKALRNFRRAVASNEEAAWKNYLADQLNLNADAVTFETIERELEKQNVSPELIRSIRDRFARQDTEYYAPQGTSPRKAPSAKELVRQIEKTTRSKVGRDRRARRGQLGELSLPNILLLICLLPAFNSDAATPEQTFEQAIQLRAEKPDEATPLFTEAALGFEPQKQFLNAGNSWFFAGESGRALANYLAAESRNPFNRQIRESIAFIRAQCTDVFQTSDTPGVKISGFWKQFGRWSPAIRSALLICIYLTGWMVYIAARFIGKTIPRYVWLIIGFAALIPAISLLTSIFQPLEGVVIQSAEARLGPGYAYDAAYDSPLHEGTELQTLETRDGWVHARMPDKSEAWIPESACTSVQ